jgi:TRAP-type C4-dicarboxylate transport system substrate-binding protein
VKPIFRTLAVAGLSLSLSLACALPALAQGTPERIILFGHLNNADHPVSFGGKRFAELLAARSGGKMKVQEHPASTSQAGTVREFGPVDFPFSISNFAQADAPLDGPLGQALIAKQPEKGLIALGCRDLGFRNVTSSKRAITKAEELDGQENPFAVIVLVRM